MSLLKAQYSQRKLQTLQNIPALDSKNDISQLRYEGSVGQAVSTEPYHGENLDEESYGRKDYTTKQEVGKHSNRLESTTSTKSRKLDHSSTSQHHESHHRSKRGSSYKQYPPHDHSDEHKFTHGHQSYHQNSITSNRRRHSDGTNPLVKTGQDMPSIPPQHPPYPPHSPRDFLICVSHSLLSASDQFAHHYNNPLKIPLEVHSLSRFAAKHYHLPRTSKFTKVGYLCHILRFLSDPHNFLPAYQDLPPMEVHLDTPVIRIENIETTLIIEEILVNPLFNFLVAHSPIDPTNHQPIRPFNPPHSHPMSSRPLPYYPQYPPNFQWLPDHEREHLPDPYWDMNRDFKGNSYPQDMFRDPSRGDLDALINAPSAEQKRLMDSGVEIMQLLSEPTAGQTLTAKRFQSKDGTQLREICQHCTREECCRAHQSPFPCKKVHFRRIILPHTEISLGDCSYLDTCRHITTCKYVHYEVDKGSTMSTPNLGYSTNNPFEIGAVDESNKIDHPAQWISCDIRKFDFTILKNMKIRVVMADPPWDIHMDLPYGTMTDNEMKSLGVNQIQTEGVLFLWVTGRAMEVGRECMEIWGYRRVEEIVWVKTNQLQRIIRTGRTGHWLNHSKEHCLVGIKGNPKINKNLDCDVIVSEVRETSRKPDEIYRIIERMCPNCLKIELFGRHHNTRNNWITLGNQLKGNELHHPILLEKLKTQPEEIKGDENIQIQND